MYLYNKKGQNNPNAKLDEEKVKEIRRIFRLKQGKKNKFGNIDQTWIGEKFGVSQRTISAILSNQIWTKNSHSKWDLNY